MSGPTQPLDMVLRRIACEVAELASVADHLETALDTGGVRLDPRLIIQWQALDALTQRLAGLTQFLDVLATTAPGRFPLPVAAALERLPLADQARRLAGLTPAIGRPVPGDLSLFD
jgi:hypothetical protein